MLCSAYVPLTLPLALGLRRRVAHFISVCGSVAPHLLPLGSL